MFHFLQIQLVNDPNRPNLYRHVLVDALGLSRVERMAFGRPNPALAMTNGIISLVFPREELAAAKGIGLRNKGKEGRCLDGIKVSAIKGNYSKFMYGPTR